MSLNALSNAIEKKIVDNVHGWGVEVSYTYRSTNTTITSVRTMAQHGSFIKLDEKDQVYRDRMTFFSLFLDTKPSKGDTIVHEGVTWIVDILEGSNPYDIVCIGNNKHSNSRSGRREI